jgi:hypothetical protein
MLPLYRGQVSSVIYDDEQDVNSYAMCAARVTLLRLLLIWRVVSGNDVQYPL